MAWSGFQNQNGTVRRLFIEEGNVAIMLIPTTPTRVRFLTLDEADIAAQATAILTKGSKSKKVGKEELAEYIATTFSKDHWVMPISVWEHTVKDGARFSLQVCLGMQQCKLCAGNAEAKQNGIVENKLLPFPVRRRFVVPIWSYEHKRLFFLKQAEDFFIDVKTYIDQNKTSSLDFDIYRTGSGFGTKYKAIFVQKSESDKWPIDQSKVLKPCDIRWADHSKDKSAVAAPAEEEPAAEEEAESAEPAPTPSSAAQKKDAPGDFVLSFGSHKGKTLQQLCDKGLMSYVQFLADSATGLVQEKAAAFIELNK